MEEATWGETVKSPTIDWRMSAALENVPRGVEDLAEVTSLETAVRDWQRLDAGHRSAAIITPERALLIDGVSHETFSGDGISTLVDRLPTQPANEG